MPEHVTSFVKKCKSWTIKNVMANYLKAINMYSDILHQYHSGKDIKFSILKQLSEILFSAKEDLHLIYRRLSDPRHNIFEETEKYTPNEAEMNLINNVGLLFHKAMVTREIKYMMEYYETGASEDYFELEDSLHRNIDRMGDLFQKAESLLEKFLANFQDDPVILSYFLENERYVESTLGKNITNLFKHLAKNGDAEKSYIKVANYFIESGWPDRAKRILYEALRFSPGNRTVKAMIARCV